MAKKLFVVWLLITMVTFSSISIYATEQTQGDFFIPKTPLMKVNEEDANSVKEEKESRTKTEPEKLETAMAVKATAVRSKLEDKEYLEGLSSYIRHVNRNVGKQESMDMAESFVKYAEKYGVDEKIVMAIAQNESCYYSDAVSCEDFKGLMQTGDGLARNAGYDPQELFNPAVSIKVGARYISMKLDEFGDVSLALTAYNQGSGSVHSGNYSTGYAELAMARTAAMEDYLEENGYVE
ncbi:murein transglycosylase C [uncultured Eubacterium sp.]|nr:murein transglycosylase C [uncultured Eubacterium sp.]